MNSEEIYFWRVGLSDEPLEEEREAEMNSETIMDYKIEGSTDPSYYTYEAAQWLKEIAYQLAVANERAAQQPTFVFDPRFPNAQPSQNYPENAQPGRNR